MPKSIGMQQEGLLYIDEQKNEALAILERLRGSVKIKRRMTKKELDKLALDFTPGKEDEIIKRYGLKF